MKARCYLAIVVLWALPMFGQTGKQLISQCKVDTHKSARDPYDAGYCQGLIMGVAAMQQSSFWAWPKASVPADVTPGQKILVVEKYLENHPAELGSTDWNLVIVALSEKWPEPKKGGQQ
jgi:hypothetical protein